MLRIISLNLNGIRSAWSKNVLPWAAAQDADIICLQELKAQLPDLTAEMLSPDGMRAFYHCAEKKGYSGVGIWSRREPDRVVAGFDGGEFDAEGLRAAIAAAPTPGQRFAVLERALRESMQQFIPAPRAVRDAATRIEQSLGKNAVYAGRNALPKARR